MEIEKIEKIPEWEKQVKLRAIEYLEKGKQNWDVPHTELVVKRMKEIIENINGNPRILVPTAYLHDLGYGLVPKFDIKNYDKVLDVKVAHAELGADESRKILQEIGDFTEDEIKEIEHLIRVHDRLPDLKTDNEIAICEADSLGMIDVEQIRPSFSKESFQKFLDEFIKFRVPLFKNEFSKEKLLELLVKARKYAEIE